MTAAASRGFVYAASTMGVTGERTTVGPRAEQLVADTRAAGAEHVCVGLGVSKPEQARDIGRYADGVIVGSAFVRALAGAGTREAGLEAVTAVAAGLAEGVRTAR
jgi:tryptophan synthase alpha chain